MKPLEKRRPRPPKASGREKPSLKLVPIDTGGEAPPVMVTPTLVSAIESFHHIAHELPPLFQRHWRELALDQDKIPLEPDWDRYYDLATIGTLRVMTARVKETGALVGYIFNLIAPHLHYRTALHVDIEMFWLDPVYRGGLFALHWLKDNEREMKKLGAKRISCGLKNHYMQGRVGSLFRRMGYSPVETIWSKVT